MFTPTPKKLDLSPHPSRVWGFTIIELILVVSIISILAVVTSSVGSSFLVRNATKNVTQQLISDLRIAQLNSVSGKGDSSWGVKVGSNQLILFKGSSFASRDQSLDEVASIPSSININDSEVVFQKLVGDSLPTTITVANNVGESINISVNEAGSVNVN